MADSAVDFDLLLAGIEGRVEVTVTRPESAQLPLATVPVDLPPVLPDFNEKLHAFLDCPESLPVHSLESAQRFWTRKASPSALYTLDVGPLQTTLVVDREPTTGKLIGFSEEQLANIHACATNSTSLGRLPAALKDSIRGNTTNFPFWPGGLEEPNLSKLDTQEKGGEYVDFENDLLQTPPGFQCGAHLTAPSRLPGVFSGPRSVHSLSLADILAQSDAIELTEPTEPVAADEPKEPPPLSEEITRTGQRSIDDIVKLETKEEAEEKSAGDSDDWAVAVDTKDPVKDFYKRIPDLAYKWDFELDVFQKRAILCLEEHKNVFVAAHTSAGKTVIAEYAIALSLKHMTKTIYTSPIKALSNQKYRDFKKKFTDVGLITGDVQISPEAPCLIMTTEILRSMLYSGSDVIRDLEWVVFDEVHYINDAERGVVWEEVLIMLPQHVKIILLSATVPNTMEFAGWIGRTKQRHVYVVSTSRRPVPLKHFLYTGNSVKTSGELFLILNENEFITNGYRKALEAKLARSSKSSQSYGTKGTRSGNPQQDKNVWLSLIGQLRKMEKLPAVAFIFSKKRIDENARQLASVDLLTSSEKSEVHVFFERCVGRLKPVDRDLPQVRQVRDLLQQGLGIHHSGVLPLLKEIVEMLFEKGLVKILFATETFAMGVNMPARTVLFDSLLKFDGHCQRYLLSNEYIQMAGRAGRRGQDDTGTVIVLCRGDVPELSDLHAIMLGKASVLQSRFRLTYSMLLNLLRVEKLHVEDMLRRSFSEFHRQRYADRHKDVLTALAAQRRQLPTVADDDGELLRYYDTCVEYRALKEKMAEAVLTQPLANKLLSAGRVIVTVATADRPKALAIILQSRKDRTYTALTLCDPATPPPQYGKPRDSTRVTPVLPTKLFRPVSVCGHCIVQLVATDVDAITTKTVKLNADAVIEDSRRRKQARFRNDPPGQSVTVATQELLRLVEANPTGLPSLDPIRDLHMRDIDVIDQFHRIRHLEDMLFNGGFSCINDLSFIDNFNQLQSNMRVESEFNDLSFQLSDASLQLLPEYHQRVEVLRRLQYVDAAGTVQMKGLVACEISLHELILTELLFDNALAPLHPPAIAALLSAVVFQQRQCSRPQLSPELVQAQERFLQTALNISELQVECGVLLSTDTYLEEFNFGLMQVVFEWAKGAMTFAEIMQLTDVQEGVIVRTIQRLHEVITDVRNATRIIGEPVLFRKLEETAALIRRDIVFAASLYLQ